MSFEPPWINEFTIKAKDASGWTIFTPSTNSQIVYVDATGGNDTLAGIQGPYVPTDTEVADPFNPVGIQAYQTLTAALATRRADLPDWVLLKRGEEWTNSTHISMVQGEDASNPQFLGAYGSTATARPLIKCSEPSDGFRSYQKKYFTVADIEFYAYQNDYTSADYIGWENITATCRAAYIFDSASTTLSEHILIEGCKFSWFTSGIDVESTYHQKHDEVERKNIQLRRNVIQNITPFDDGAHAQGLWCRISSVLIEENMFIHNGWNMKSGSIAGAPLVSEALAVELSDVSEIAVSVDGIPSDAPSSGELKITSDVSGVVYVNYSSFTGNTYTIAATDFSGTVCSVGSEAMVAQARATQYNHSTYMTGCRNSIIKGNISSSPSAIHHKFTSNMKKIDAQATTLAVALTGAAETFVVIDSEINTDQQYQIGTLDITLDNASVLAVNYTSFAGSTYTIEATNFSVNGAVFGNDVDNQLLHNTVLSWDTAMYDNLYLDGEIVASFGGNETNENNYRWSGFRFQGNTSMYIGKNQNTNRTLGYGAEANEHEAPIITDNLFLHTENGSVTGYAVALTNYASLAEIYNNKVFEAPKLISQGNATNQIDNDTYNNAVDLLAASYVDSTRTLATYLTSISEPNTLADFESALGDMRKGAWDTRYTQSEIDTYLQAGYVFTSDVIIADDLPALHYHEGSYTTKINVVSDYAITYEWLVDGEIDTANTTHEFSDSGFVGSFTLQCKATANGTQVSSTISTVEKGGGRVTFKNSTQSYASMTAITYGLDDEITFDFNIPVQADNEVIVLGGESSNATIRVSIDQPFLIVRLGGSSQLVSAPDYRDGLDHTFRHYRDPDGQGYIIIDGTVKTPETLLTETPEFTRVGLSQGGTVRDNSVWNLSIGNTTYAINSLGIDTETEEAISGTGTLTYHNVVAGDWDEVGLKNVKMQAETLYKHVNMTTTDIANTNFLYGIAYTVDDQIVYDSVTTHTDASTEPLTIASDGSIDTTGWAAGTWTFDYKVKDANGDNSSVYTATVVVS